MNRDRQTDTCALTKVPSLVIKSIASFPLARSNGRREAAIVSRLFALGVSKISSKRQSQSCAPMRLFRENGNINKSNNAREKFFQKKFFFCSRRNFARRKKTKGWESSRKVIKRWKMLFLSKQKREGKKTILFSFLALASKRFSLSPRLRLLSHPQTWNIQICLI